MKRALILVAALILGSACAAEESIGLAGTTKVTSTNAEALEGLRSTAGLTDSQISDATALDAAKTTCAAFNSGQQTFERMTDNIQNDTSISFSQRSVHFKVLSWSVAYFCPWHIQS